MKVEKSVYYNSFPISSTLKKSFYKEDLTKEAVDFSSDLADESSSQNPFLNEDEKQNDLDSEEKQEIDKLTSNGQEEKKDNEKEKLNIIA